MGKRRVSIKDIAREANVSHSTVSRALRDSHLISTERREQIQEIAREMGYTLNAVAQSLQTQRTNTIGLVVTSIGDPFFAEVVNGVEEVARPAGHSVFLNSSHSDPDQEIQVIEAFHRRRVDGILVAASRIGSYHLERLERIEVPVVLINNEAEGGHDFLHSVAVDDRAGARQAVDHLLQLGHRRIGYLGVSNRPRSNRRRLEGYCEAMEQAGITPRDEWVTEAPLKEAGGDAEAAQDLALTLIERGVTAVFCYNDMVAVGALLACRHHGLDVPAECSVIGFDGIDFTKYVSPSLTTVNQPKRKMGNIAMQMLMDLLNEQPVENHTLSANLLLRGSTGPCEGRDGGDK